jgi:aspartate carbamoyltransferase regulatory subunit
VTDDAGGDPDPQRDATGDEGMRVARIRDGTVIDHVRAGQALNVLRVLDIDGEGGETVSVGMNVPSDRLGQKDVVKVEGRELSQAEVDVISLIASDATVNLIRDFGVVEKRRVSRPDRVVGVVSCPNPRCITAADEPVDAAFEVLADGLRCEYCDTVVRDAVTEHLAD